jgi:hypothetical protein
VDVDRTNKKVKVTLADGWDVEVQGMSCGLLFAGQEIYHWADDVYLSIELLTAKKLVRIHRASPWKVIKKRHRNTAAKVKKSP